MARVKGRDAYLARLGKVPLFAACTQTDLKRLARATTDISVPAGTTLTKEGTTGQEFFVVADGKAVVKRKNRKVGGLGPGDFFGELALLDKGPRTATVVADTDMDLIVLDRPSFAAVLDEVPHLSHKLLAGLARRLHEVEPAV